MGAYLAPSLHAALIVPLGPHHFNSRVMDLYDKWYRLQRSSLCNSVNFLVHLT